jgi:2Fe-2S ferredoxin
MALVKYIEFDGTAHDIHVEDGTTVMQGAVNNMVNGIIADCGGTCSCATCHCYVDESWFDKLDPPSETELDMLECVLDPKPNSRLSCQIVVTEELDGLVVRVPESQY